MEDSMKHNRTLFGVGIVALALLAVGGSGLALAQDPGSSVLDTGGDEEESVAPESVTLSEADAVGIATAETNGTVEEVELESEDGTPAYEVELVTADGTETEVTVHADDGTVLEAESEAEDDEMEDDEMEDDEMEDEYESNESEGEDEEESVAPENVTLSEEDAVSIATAETNGTVEEVELESEDGTPAYEVELVTADGTETEVTVHADDGTVLEFESEDD
jgi:uncharacterized membrane protein YkoI